MGYTYLLCPECEYIYADDNSREGDWHCSDCHGRLTRIERPYTRDEIIAAAEAEGYVATD